MRLHRALVRLLLPIPNSVSKRYRLVYTLSSYFDLNVIGNMINSDRSSIPLGLKFKFELHGECDAEL